ncbi:MAG: hypothetical protein K8T89_06395 [Planctomycetes bacterium]|nr:hypothetical protein [Planctomycetota bacterium]
MAESYASMKYAEENHAKDLHHEMTWRFAESVPPTALTIDGAGVHWHCTARRGSNFCSIACFDSKGPEFLTSFKRDSDEAAIGRTSSLIDTVNAVDDWLQGQQLSGLYHRFHFVDDTKRALKNIRDDVLACLPDLAAIAPSELQHRGCDIYDLWFIGADRSCRISYFGKNEFPDAFFYWDKCELFHFKVRDHNRLADVLNLWICFRVMPSVMRTDFPWIEIGELADYYEGGIPIEGEFVKSWDSIERFYGEINETFVLQVRKLIAKLREKGHDKLLRAGQSMWSLVVSRARRHGLRLNQPSITFWFLAEGMDVYINIKEPKKITYAKIEFTAEIEALLQTLEAEDID